MQHTPMQNPQPIRNRLIPITFSDGEIRIVDSLELFEEVDFFASIYGLGANKNLSEFIKMIDNEDPLITENLKIAAVERIKAMHGIDDNSLRERGVENMLGQSKSPNFFNPSKGTVDNQETLIRFLLDFGATKEEIEQAKEKLKKIKTIEEDFSWITPETLYSPEFDFRGTLARMNECSKRSVNINVSLDKLVQKMKAKKNGR